jgi:small subunit ribosomal protein S6
MKYEAILVTNPDMSVNKLDTLINNIINIIEKEHGVINNIQKLGKRKLAYRINNFHEGYYVQCKFNGDNKVISLIEKFCKIDDLIIRFMIIKNIVKKPKLQSIANINNKRNKNE